MKGVVDIVCLNVAWLALEWAKWTDVIESGLSILGAITLLCINMLRLRKALNEQGKVDKP